MNKRALDNNKEKGVAEDVWIPTLCYECNMGICSIRVHRVDGVVVNLEGNAEGETFEKYAQNQGATCPKAFGNIQKLYNPHRIKAPMKRTNPEKGRGIDPKWEEISWEEALDSIAKKMKNILADDPKKFVEIGPGRKRSINGSWECFRQALGPINLLRSGGGTHCRMTDHVFGVIWHRAFTCEPDYSYLKYLLLFGYNVMASGGATLNYLLSEARARGIKMVVVDPVLSVTAAKADEWIPIKPCTDAAFLLALIHVIIYEIGVYDQDFLKRMTNSPYLVGQDGYFIRDKKLNKPFVWDGIDQKAKIYNDETIKDFALEGSYQAGGKEGKPAFQVLKDHVRQYTPDWASEITEIPPETIRRIAGELVDNAMIGSTIDIKGVKLPYRPVAITLGRGVSGGFVGHFQAFLANHILTVLLGSLETVGGHTGGTAHPGGRYATKAEGHSAIKPDNDGMLGMESGEFEYPPVSSDACETLFPYLSVTEADATGISWINYSDPPEGIPSPPDPEMAIVFRVNPLTSLGDPRRVERVIRKIPFLVSIAYVENEMTDFADLVIPDHTDMERYELAAQARAKAELSGWSLRQPVIDPIHNTMEISDICTELADRLGVLSKYNSSINEGLNMGMAEPYKLELDKKYTWEEIQDRQCRTCSDGKYGLDWFKKNGAVMWDPPPEKSYSVHSEMIAKNCRYYLPYVEHVKITGEKLRKNLDGVGIGWWPTEEYVPLPTYFESVLEEVPPEYNFYVTRCTAMHFYRAANVSHPWLLESAEHIRGQGKVVMNADAAQKLGIKDEDEIWVESPENRIKSRVKLVQGIRPDTLQIPANLGHWTTPGIKDKNWVTLNSLIPLKYSWTDPMTGAIQVHVIKAKVYKA